MSSHVSTPSLVSRMYSARTASRLVPRSGIRVPQGDDMGVAEACPACTSAAGTGELVEVLGHGLLCQLEIQKPAFDPIVSVQAFIPQKEPFLS